MAAQEIMYLPGVGPKRAALLQKEFGVRNAADLLRIYPNRYIEKGGITAIRDVNPDAQSVQVKAFIKHIELVGTPSEPIKFNAIKRMNVTITDGTGEMTVTFFKGIKWMYAKLSAGGEYIFFGKPGIFNGRLNMVHPDVDDPKAGATIPDVELTAVYPSGEKLKNAGITNKVMGKIMQSALNAGLGDVEETIPDYLMRSLGLVPLHYALRNIHFPQSKEALEKARYRIKFEELFFLQLALLKQKFVRSRADNGIKMTSVGEAFNKCYSSLPFSLTGAQKKVIREIHEDLRSGHQMNRLLQGDVGSGKTMVAVLSALIAVGNGYQACIMAPTEVLTNQHYKNICKYLQPTGVRAALLTGSTRTAERREIHANLENGNIGIIVGTHALLEDKVKFHRLGLAIIDEQHRFGVEQRSKLWSKSCCDTPPHILVMTATPIPRTLAMTLYGDLDISVIDELPPGRKPVQTVHGTESKRPGLYSFIRKEIEKGRQAFIVYPLIFESETLDYQNLEQGIDRVRKDFPFPPYKIAVVHGKQNTEEKDFNMSAFAEGRANILVATSVIEVGVDVPNASVMVIESAERFGLSQLHQLRGRVGRGSENSYCILMTGNKISKDSRHRIELMCSTENGFVLAEEDMKMRGPGDIEGTQQSGLPVTLSMASLSTDVNILNAAKHAAEAVLTKDPTLRSDENERLRRELRREKYDIVDYSKIS